MIQSLINILLLHHFFQKKQKQLEKKKEGIEEDLEGHVFAPVSI